MSSSELLTQAMIDAQTLKEVALKNAENLIMEKYADKIKEAVDSMLEQDDKEETEIETGMEDEDLGTDLENTEDKKDSSITEHVPYAAAGGERLCSCPEEDEEIEIDFDDLQQQMEQEPEVANENPLAASPMPLSSADGILTGDETEDEYELKEEDLNNFLREFEDKEETEKETIEQVQEVLKVDTEPVKSGWKDVSGSKTELNTDMALARAQDSEEQEKIAKLMKAKEKVETELKEERNIIKTLNENILKNKKLLAKAYDVINEMTLTNTKLLYTNRVYQDNSLNERQKMKIAETLSGINMIDEVKVVYETLKSSMSGIFSGRKTLKESLSETINKPSGLMFQKRDLLKEQNSDGTVNQITRMQVLAGIKKGEKR